MEIIKERAVVEHKRKVIEFEWPEDRGSGFSFDADDEWNPIFRSDLGKQNYEACMSGKFKIDGPFRHVHTFSSVEPAQGKCSCGTVVDLTDQYMGACQCPKCGRWYNMFGQSLTDPKYWEKDDVEY